MNFGFPRRTSSIQRYSPVSVHLFKRTGSLCPRFAFCEKFVFGRLTVFLRSKGSVIVGVSKVKILTFIEFEISNSIYQPKSKVPSLCFGLGLSGANFYIRSALKEQNPFSRYC